MFVPKSMRSILTQLAKYQPPEGDRAKVPTIEVKEVVHPYERIVRALCEDSDPTRREELIGDALAGLNDFNPPPMTDQLYPIETAILYHLFYRHRIQLCGETKADSIMGAFLKHVADRDGGLDVYMSILKNMLDKTATTIFLYRVMLAAFGARTKHDNQRDHVDRGFGLRAGAALGVKPSAKTAARGLDGMAVADVEQLILGRVTYLAFWEWSRSGVNQKHTDYLALPAHVKAIPSS